MAFTNTPVISTYSTQHLSCVYDLDIPPGVGTVDSSFGMKNIVPIKIGDAIWGEARSALNAITVGNGTVRGMYVWQKGSAEIYYYVVVSTFTTSSVYSSADGITWAIVNVLGVNTTSPVRFAEFISSTNVKKLVMVDGLDGYVFLTNAAGTKIADADFPTPHVPFPVVLDGYLVLAKASTGDIYNSDLDDPAIWTAGSFISAELYADDIQALLKIDNYVVAVGTQGTEFFYDAANPTASPLARVDGAAMSFGTPYPNSIAYTKDQAIFLANNNDGSVSLRHIQGTKSEELPFNLINYLSSVLNETTATQVRGWFYRQSGHLYYGLTVDGVDTPATSAVFVYGFDTKLWTEFSYNYTAGGDEAFPVVFTAPTTTNSMVTYFAGNPSGGAAVFGTITSSTVTDDTIASVVTDTLQEVRTSIEDFGTMNLKTMGRLSLIMTSSFGSNGQSNVAVSASWADLGDYSFTAGHTINLYKGSESEYPYATQLGAFRQRAIRLQYTGPLDVRWKMIEVEINKGMR